MKRVLVGATGAFLLFLPALIAYTLTVPVPEFRTGTVADYDAFLVTCLILYGGAAAGVLVQWRLRARNGQALTGESVFWGGLTGAFVAVVGALAIASVREGLGNLWGLVVLFGGVLSAVVGAGAGLLGHALRAGRPQR